MQIATVGGLGPHLLPHSSSVSLLLSLPWELWEPALHWASFEPWSHHAWPQQRALVPCIRALKVKNSFIKSEKELSALHTAILGVPVTRREGFVWRGTPLWQSEASKPQGHPLLPALQLSSTKEQQHWLLPKGEAQPETLPCVAYVLEREFLWLTQHLTEWQSLFLSFHKSIKTTRAGKPFSFAPKKPKMCSSVMQLLVVFSHWSQQHFHPGLPSASGCLSRELLHAGQTVGSQCWMLSQSPALPSPSHRWCSCCLSLTNLGGGNAALPRKAPKPWSFFPSSQWGGIGISGLEKGAGGSSHSRSLLQGLDLSWSAAEKLWPTSGFSWCRSLPWKAGDSCHREETCNESSRIWSLKGQRPPKLLLSLAQPRLSGLCPWYYTHSQSLSL